MSAVAVKGAKLIDKSADQCSVPATIVSPASRDEEISFIDIWRILAYGKWLVLVSLAGSLLLAAAYLYFAKPSYKAYAHLLPPQQQDIQELYIVNSGVRDAGVGKYTPEFVYSMFQGNLNSWSIRRDFYDIHHLAKYYMETDSDKDVSADRIFETLFNAHLSVQVDPNFPSSVKVSYIDANPRLAARWLNEFIEFVNARTKQQIFNNVNAVIRAETSNIQQELASKLMLAVQRKNDTIFILNEALSVAKKLGIREMVALTTSKKETGLTVSEAQLPLYTRGTAALKAELTVIEARKSEEPFIPGFRDLQEKLYFLKNSSIDVNSLSTVTVDEAARIPNTASNPKKIPVILIATFMGVLLGVISAFVYNVRSNSV